MSLTLFLSQLGSFILGITFGFAIFFHMGSKNSDATGADGCLGVLFCTLGTTVALLCYVAAINVV